MIGLVEDRMMSSPQMTKRMKYPVREPSDGMMPLVELPVASSVRNQSLHHVVGGQEIDDVGLVLIQLRSDLVHAEDFRHPALHHRLVFRKNHQGSHVRICPKRKVSNGIRPQEKSSSDRNDGNHGEQCDFACNS